MKELVQSQTNHDRDGEDVIENITGKMSLEEKVGQVFIISLRKINSEQPVLRMNRVIEEQIRRFHLGGVILFDENLYSPAQTKELIDGMQEISNISLLTAIDEEGGATSRLNANPGSLMHATILPANVIIGRSNDPEMAYKAGAVIGRELVSLGFNMDFAPVADIASSFKNPYLGPRTFGTSPKKAARMVAAEVAGLHSQNILAVLKHFPGHGATIRDTHMEPVVIPLSRKQLDRTGFVPFISGINAGVDGVMTAHLQAPKVTGGDVPATLSKEILTGILRMEMKFNGLIITDALEMKAISRQWDPGEAAVKAFEAGADILLMPSDLEMAFNSLLNAVHDGRITELRLNESVMRILGVKHKRNILARQEIHLDPEQVLGCREHLEVAAEIADKAKLWTRIYSRFKK